jgi:hypothetical protein
LFQLSVGEANEIALVKDLLEDFDIFVAYFWCLASSRSRLDGRFEDRVDRFEISLDSRI